MDFSIDEEGTFGGGGCSSHQVRGKVKIQACIRLHIIFLKKCAVLFQVLMGLKSNMTCPFSTCCSSFFRPKPWRVQSTKRRHLAVAWASWNSAAREGWGLSILHFSCCFLIPTPVDFQSMNHPASIYRHFDLGTRGIFKTVGFLKAGNGKCQLMRETVPKISNIRQADSKLPVNLPNLSQARPGISLQKNTIREKMSSAAYSDVNMFAEFEHSCF